MVTVGYILLELIGKRQNIGVLYIPRVVLNETQYIHPEKLIKIMKNVEVLTGFQLEPR